MKKITLNMGVAAIAISTVLIAAPAFAQETAANDTQAEIFPAGEAIVVTGSRINNPNVDLSSPVNVVGEEELKLQQAASIEQVLRQIPGVVADVGANLNNGNGGSTFINLRGIGSNRNIALLNGTRIVPANLQGEVNLDIIPVALLKRVDVLTGGAGSVYGADAIGGVVNFITKNDFEGMEFSVGNEITEEGDGYQFRGDLTLGANFDDGRGNATFSMGYTKRDLVTQGARDFTRDNVSSVSGNAGGSSTAVPSRFSGINGIAGFAQISPDGQSLVPFYEPFNFNPDNALRNPLEQYRMFGTANYEISDGIRVFAEGLFVSSTTDTQAAPSGNFGNILQIPVSNPFISDGIRQQLCDSLGTVNCAAAALATDPNDPNFEVFSVSPNRRFVELGPRKSAYKTQLFQLKGGVKGSITDNIDFEAFAAYGESENVQRQSGNGTLTRLLQSAYSTSETECLDTSNGCVPINLFGPAGSISQGVADFLDIGNSSSVFTTLKQVGGFITGDAGFSITSAAQPINFVLGTEWREYGAGTRSDLLSQTSGEVLGNGASNPDQFGEYNVKEVYGELVIPILAGMSFVDELNLELGGRISDYSTTGTEYTWKVGGTYAPVPSFRFRGNYQRVTRAPNINELFSPQNVGLGSYDSDPCAGPAAGITGNLLAVCLGQGAPASSIGSILVDPAGQTNVSFGGNINLNSEKATTWTVGAVFQPDFVQNLSISVDYYNIKIVDAISTPTEDDVLANCFGLDYANGNFTLDGTSAASAACNTIRREPVTGNLFGPVSTTPGLPTFFSNQGRISTDGIDLVMLYKTDLGFADLGLDFSGNWTNSSKFQATPVSVNRECVGFYSASCASIQPEFSFKARTTLSVEDIDVSLLWRWQDEQVIEPAVQGNFQPEFESIDAYSMFDLTVRAQAAENFTLVMGVTNLLNKEPPFVGSNIGATGFNAANTYPSSYDVLGRRYSVTATLNF